MWANFPGVSSPLKLSGSKTQGGAQLYYIEAKPEEFMVDGEIWTELVCFLNAQSYLDRQGSMVEMMQLVQNELISRDTAMDNIPYVVNRKRENEKMDRDRKWRAEGMAIAQQAANSLMTANPDIGAQERTNYGLERGFMGEMPGISGPVAQMPPGPGGPAPGGPPGDPGTPLHVSWKMLNVFSCFAG